MRKSQLYSLVFGISLLLLLLFSLLLYNAIHSLTIYSHAVERSHQVMFNLQKLQANVVDIETSQRGFLITHDSSFLEPLLRAREHVPSVLDTLLALSAGNDIQRHNTEVLKTSIVERLSALQEILNESYFYTEDRLSTRLKADKILMDEFRDEITKVENEELATLQKDAASKSTYERITPNYFKVILSITTAIALISFTLLMRELNQRLASQNLLETRFHALNQSNSELQQIAYVTSHDLQEPLRKIRTFSDVLITKYEQALNHDGKAILDRMNQNVLTMQERIADLSSFASLSATGESNSAVDLHKIVLDVQHELRSIVDQKKATITLSLLPVVHGYAGQLQILFREILDNALKFSRDGVQPRITITANQVRGDQLERLEKKYSQRNFTVVTVYDNGIGFENEYSSKIFILFQRLHMHESPYQGKGIGLAICQRIMTNHDGFITANGEPGQGATIRLYFPQS